MLIHLIGPGGSGKTTTGRALGIALGLPFVDLDEEYLKRGSIEHDIDLEGYDFYARRNTELYLDLSNHHEHAIIALSSGFMLYPARVHPLIEQIHESVLSSPSTVLLLTSLELERCVQETTTRQMSKAYMTSTEEHQRNKIRERFHEYYRMGNIRVSTDKPTELVVTKLVDCLAGARLT